jgi:hypothetical protein
MSFMRRGEFDAAWRVSDALLDARRGQTCWHWPRHFQYVWDGTSLEGRRVLVRCYHGLGDTVQFIRYAPLLRSIAEKVVVWAQPGLIPLLTTVEGIDRLLPLHDGEPEVAYDVDVEVMELPYVFRTTLQTIPRRVPYVFGQRRNARSHPPRKVGVVWKAGGWNERRSMPAAMMATLNEVPGVELRVLQNHAAAEEWPGPMSQRQCAEPVTELAAAILDLDLLITIDSLAAHLGGALGVPTWTLLPKDPDWRWMENRADSPWYPTMRLWRQSRAGDWESVMHDVRTELARLTGLRSADCRSTASIHA